MFCVGMCLKIAGCEGAEEDVVLCVGCSIFTYVRQCGQNYKFLVLKQVYR